MGLLDDLNGVINAAKRELGSLGPRPGGNPGELKQLAAVVRQEADNTAGLARLEAGIPSSMVFEGPAADRFGANAEQTASSLVRAQHLLDEAADAIERKANAIAQAQADYDRHHRGLLGKINDAVGQLPNVIR